MPAVEISSRFLENCERILRFLRYSSYFFFGDLCELHAFLGHSWCFHSRDCFIQDLNFVHVLWVRLREGGWMGAKENEYLKSRPSSKMQNYWILFKKLMGISKFSEWFSNMCFLSESNAFCCSWEIHGKLHCFAVSYTARFSFSLRSTRK